jgi:hypothetical protein
MSVESELGAQRARRGSSFVNPTDDCADDGHFNERADAPIHDQITWERLRGIRDQGVPADSQKGKHDAVRLYPY